MLRASRSKCLLTASVHQRREVATSLAPKSTPQQASAPSTSRIPSPNIGKWAKPRNNGGSTSTGANSSWRIPELKPAAPSRPPPSTLSSFPTPKFQMPRLSTPSASNGKWARPANHEAAQSSTPSSVSSSTFTYTPSDVTRLDRDAVPHLSHHPRPRSQNARTGSQNVGPADRFGRRDQRGRLSERQEASESTRRSLPRHQAGHPRWTQNAPRSAGTNVDNGAHQRSTPGHDLQYGTAKIPAINIITSREVEEIAEEDLYRRRHGSRLNLREKHKTRGSLLEGGEIEWRPRVSFVRTPREKKGKPKPKIVVTEDVYIPEIMTVEQLSRLLRVTLRRLQRKMVQVGMAEFSSYDYALSSQYASMIALEFDKNPIVDNVAAFDIYPPPPHQDPSTLPQRPPIVTIMGHVDHGKTTLLDTLRSASVAKGEAGGITQHIGAFSVPVPTSSNDTSRTITFLDTPGHAAFSAMRARGASVTDIVVLVVAADDGVMPQTKEVIELIKKDESKVSVVVAINKIDRPGVDSEAVQQSLLAEGLQLEAFGGDIPSVEVSGLTGLGLDRLVETISVVAEVADYRAEREGVVFGYVLESKLLKGLGPVATVLVLRGELTPTKHLISGTTHARVRLLSDSTGKAVKSVYPGTAVTVSGWKELPSAGDEVIEGSESDIKKAIVNRRRRLQLAAVAQDAEAINIQRRQERERKEEVNTAASNLLQDSTINDPSQETTGPKMLRLVVKGDVTGSVEAVTGALQGIGNKVATVKVVQSSVGDVAESDVMMAQAIEGVIVAFSVAVPKAVETLAATKRVPILASSVIYHLMDDVKKKVIELIPPLIEKRVAGEALVQQLFDIQVKHQTMKVAGCRVTNGHIEKTMVMRVMRNGAEVHEGAINTFRHLRKDVLELRKDMECGISLHDFNDLQEGDVIQALQIVQKPGVL